MLRITSSMAALSMASGYICGYPQWTIPGVGDDWGECHWTVCSKRVEEKCRKINVYENDVCQVTCTGDESRGTETWKCMGDDTWERVGGRNIRCVDDPSEPVEPVEPELSDTDKEPEPQPEPEP